MQQIFSVWSALDIRRRVIVSIATLAVFGAVLTMSKIASAPNMTLLYAGLESGPAGEVVSALEQRGAIYDVRGGSIFVESAMRDELRMTLASEGLPTSGGRGYELLDSLSGFGTTSQMFDAAYWRAKEGELARTIVSNSHISAARVHIANAVSNPFQRDVRATASVSITSTSGALPSAQAKALRYLIAAAVTGLDPEDVSIIDSEAGLIGSVEESAPQAAGTDHVVELRERVQRLLEARVGFGNAIVEVSVDTVTETESIRERRLDPESRVAISTDTEERTNTSNDKGGGDVTVASNLPEGDAAGADSSSSNNSESRERVNYEVSEIERELVRVPGAVKRLTVAVLVNGVPDGVTEPISLVPRPEEELETLRELVASAVGLNEERGDIITLKSMAFQPTIPLGTVAEASFFQNLNLNAMSLIQMFILAVVALVIALFVVRPVLSSPASAAPPSLASPPPVAKKSEQTSSDDLTPITGEIDDSTIPMENVPNYSNRALLQPTDSVNSTTSPADRLRQLIGERQEETVEILRGWLEDREENA